jgi:dynein light intermediate chain
LQQLLEAVFIPVDWHDEKTGFQMRKCASSRAATRADVIALGEGLGEAIAALNLHSGHACQGRMRLVLDVFDEVIRQLLVECEERGVLALRVRDELLMRAAALIEMR